jgi:cytochrome c553
MTKRIIFLILFICVVGASFWLYTYIPQLKSETAVTVSALNLEIAEFQKQEAAKLLAASGHVAEVVEVVDDGKVDLNDPKIQAGLKVYTETGSCVACHGDMGQGNVDQKAPMLAGQHDWYVYSQLVAFKKGERVNEAMQPYLETLNDEDFKSVAHYVSKMRIREAAPQP